MCVKSKTHTQIPPRTKLKRAPFDPKKMCNFAAPCAFIQVRDWGSGRPALVASVAFLSELGDVPLLQVVRARS